MIAPARLAQVAALRLAQVDHADPMACLDLAAAFMACSGANGEEARAALHRLTVGAVQAGVWQWIDGGGYPAQGLARRGYELGDLLGDPIAWPDRRPTEHGVSQLETHQEAVAQSYRARVPEILGRWYGIPLAR